MLDVLRASKGGIITWIFLAAIIVVFVISFGPGSLAKGNHGCGGAPLWAAQVNGTDIPATELDRQVDRMSNVYRQRYGDELVQMMRQQIAEQALSSLVSRTLLVQEAERRGLEVNRDEINRIVWATPDFQENGRFSREAYDQAVTRTWGSQRQYEEELRKELLVQHLEALFEASVNVPETDVKDTWKKLSDRVALTYVLFPTSDARAEVKLSDADAQAFAAKEGPRIEKYYKDNAARFDQPRKVRARHILARVQGTDDAAAKKKIEGALERLKKGEDFAKVAADVSEDENTKASGGELGTIVAGAVDPDFSKAIESLEAGQLSAPVKTQAGWEVIKVDEVTAAKKTTLDEARPIIARELLTSDRAAELQKQKAEAALAAARGGKSLSELYPEPQKAEPAKDGKPAVPETPAALTLGGRAVVARDTGFPAVAQTIPQLNVGGDLLKDAVAAQKGAVLPRAYETPMGLVVAVVKDRQHPDESAYPKEREMVENQLRMTKAEQLRQSWVETLRKNAKVVENTQLIAMIAGPAQGRRSPAGADD